MRSAAEHGTLVERLLEDVEATAGPVAWPRVEALVTALVDLYGEAMERLVGHARGSARDPATFDALVQSDELVASLLALRDMPSFTDAMGDDVIDRTKDGHFRTLSSRDAPLVSADRLVRSHRT
jgi:hypothetical protein